MASARQLVEAYTETKPLKVDREAGVIFGVRMLGSESKNSHGVSGVDGTEYTSSAHADARVMYEGNSGCLNHSKKERGVEEAFCTYRNCRTENVEGRPVTFADVHYLKSHPMSERVAEAAERGLGMFGLSHDAYSGRERIDKTRRKLVIESLKSVNTIDLVVKPATNRSLSESQELPMKSLKETLAALTDIPAGKAKWVRKLTEDSELASALDATGTNLAEAFEQAVFVTMNEPAITADAKSKRIGRLLETRERLESSTDSEPTDPPVDDKKDDTADEVTRLLGENAKLTTELAVRRLCESESFVAKPHQIEAIQALTTEAARKALIADLKQSTTQRQEVRSGFRRTQESESTIATDAKSFAAAIRN